MREPDAAVDPLAGKVVINELSNAPGSASDWIELINVSSEELELSGARLTAVHRSDRIQRFTVDIPVGTVLEPGGLVVIDNRSEAESRAACAQTLALPERLGEILLLGPNGRQLDRIDIDEAVLATMRPGQSLGRYPDGAGELIAQRRPSPGAANLGPLAADPCLQAPAAGDFDDHTFPCVGSDDSFFWLSGSRAGTTDAKFVIQSFGDDQARHIRFLDSVFYQLHDEWYFFRMLNGQPFEGEDVYQPYQGTFATVAEIYAWAQATADLPNDDPFLAWSGDRLLSTRFYDLAIDIQPRVIGAGTLIHIPARTGPSPKDEIWGFELEYRDAITYDDLMVFYSTLESTVPAHIVANLRWIVRSPAQEALAVVMEQNRLPYADRVLRYTELSTPGEVQVYHGGLVAGRVRVVRAGEPGIENATTTDILVLEEIPDYLPPARALITAVPQTPLAHINLLAKSRGIPNLYIGGITTDPAWDQLGRVRAHVAIKAVEPDRYELVTMTEEQYNTWLALVPDNDRQVPAVDMASAPLTVDLEQESAARMHELGPLLGGKSAGFLSLLATPGVAAPDHPLAITVRAYNEHIQQFRAAWLDQLLARSELRFLRYRRDRYLILEGIDAYNQRYGSPSGQIFLQAFLADHPPGDWLGDLVRAGGARAIIATTPIEPATLAAITEALQSRFGDFALTQGLRFRSSSNVEDIEGFNGAGLYNSSTGFLDPEALDDADDRARTVESALLATWSSYWSWEAYDERLSANIAALSGNMGVLVHARFDNDLELSNGVITLTRLPARSPAHAPELFGDRYEMVLNAQIGALSVTNPPPDRCVLPEVVRVRQAPGELMPRIERLQQSTEMAPGTQVMSDREALDLFAQTVAVTDLWLSLENNGLPPGHERRTVTIDFEFREMGAGWPALATGTPFESRMIVKQARSLEPSAADVPAAVAALAFPRDVLARARGVVRRVCTADRLTLTVFEAHTDPLRPPDLGFEIAPFFAQGTVTATAEIPELGMLAGAQLQVAHTDLDLFDHPGMLAGVPWNLVLTVAAARQGEIGFASLSFAPDQSWQLEGPAGSAGGSAFACTVETLHSTPDSYLLTLLAGRAGLAGAH